MHKNQCVHQSVHWLLNSLNICLFFSCEFIYLSIYFIKHTSNRKTVFFTYCFIQDFIIKVNINSNYFILFLNININKDHSPKFMY